jgi:hypothetical protein
MASNANCDIYDGVCACVSWSPVLGLRFATCDGMGVERAPSGALARQGNSKTGPKGAYAEREEVL